MDRSGECSPPRTPNRWAESGNRSWSQARARAHATSARPPLDTPRSGTAKARSRPARGSSRGSSRSGEVPSAQLFQLSLHGLIRQCGRPWTGDQHDVALRRKPRLVSPAELAQESLHPISLDRAAHLLGNGEAETSRGRIDDVPGGFRRGSRSGRRARRRRGHWRLRGRVAGFHEHQEVLRRELAPAALHDQVLRAFANPRALGKSGEVRRGDYLVATVTVSRLRPLRRRAEITRRPPTDDIRLRNPWVRLRRLLWG